MALVFSAPRLRTAPRPPGRRLCHLAALGAAARVAWPESRFWVQKMRDGTAKVSRKRSADAFMAFDAYKEQRPGTKELRLGELSRSEMKGERSEPRKVFKAL